MELDEALGKLGTWGRWQVLSYVIISCGTTITASWHMLAIVYIGYVPNHHCNVENIESVPKLDNGELSKCNVYIDRYSGNQTKECSDWKYLDYEGTTTVTQWNLVCNRGYLKDLAQTVLVVGVMVGAMFFTSLADRFGRKPVFLFSQWTMVVVGVMNAFVTNYILFLILRFITGALQQGIILTGFVMACELFAARYRTFAGIMIENFWAVAWCLLPLISYILPDWRHFQLFISLIGLLSIPMFWLTPESVVWLCANDRQGEAEEIIRNAAKMNKIEMPDHILSSVHHDMEDKANAEQETKQGGGILAKFKKLKRVKKEKNADEPVMVYTLMDVFRNRKLTLYASIMSLLWMVITLVYYGLSLSTATLAGNRYVNGFLNAIIEIPAYTSSYFVLNKWGRKYPLTIYLCIAGVTLIMTQIIPSKAGEVSLLPLIITLNMIGKFGITGSFGIVFLYAPEIFPTTLRKLIQFNLGLCLFGRNRSQAMGIASLVGRIGNLIATYAPFMFLRVPWLPAPLFGTLSIVAGMLVFLLPETLNRPLPQTIEDIENWSKTPPPSAAKDQPKDPNADLEMDNKGVQFNKVV